MELPDSIAGVALVGLGYALKSVADLVVSMRRARTVRRVESEAMREKALQDTKKQEILERNAHYRKFWDEAHTLLDDMCNGSFRMPRLWTVRDRYGILMRIAPDPVVQQARAVTRIFEEVLTSGFTEQHHARFNRAMHEFRDRCREDSGLDPLSKPPTSDAAAENAAAVDRPQAEPETRRYFSSNQYR